MQVFFKKKKNKQKFHTHWAGSCLKPANGKHFKCRGESEFLSLLEFMFVNQVAMSASRIYLRQKLLICPGNGYLPYVALFLIKCTSQK